MDFDYTAMTNMLLDFGCLILEGNNWKDEKFYLDPQKIVSGIMKYCYDTSLQADAIYDQVFNHIIKGLPEIVERYVAKSEKG